MRHGWGGAGQHREVDQRQDAGETGLSKVGFSKFRTKPDKDRLGPKVRIVSTWGRGREGKILPELLSASASAVVGNVRVPTKKVNLVT
jgi:hypothetical protein